jgi:hypothetical protein
MAQKWILKENMSEKLNEVACLFQRAIQYHFFDSTVWASFLHFAILNHAKIDYLGVEVLSHVSSRAIKNSFSCMTSPALWNAHLLIKEMTKSSSDDMIHVMKEGIVFMSNGSTESLSQYLVSCLSSLRRAFGAGRRREELFIIDGNLREIFQMFLEVLNKKDRGHSIFDLVFLMAHFEAFYYNDKEKAYVLFTELSKKFHIDHIFLKWIDLALYFQDVEVARDVYNRAVRRPMLNSENIYRSWISFEEKFGSVQTMIAALNQISLCRDKDSRNTCLQQKLAKSSTEMVVPNEETKAAATETESKKRRREKDSEIDPKKLKKDENRIIGDISNYKVIPNANAGQMVFLGDLPSIATADLLLLTVSNYGEIIDLHIYPNEDTGVLEALVEFSNSVCFSSNPRNAFVNSY